MIDDGTPGSNSTRTFTWRRAALAIAQGGWPHDWLMTLVKTGLTGISPAGADALENYVLEHRIRGEQWAALEPWVQTQIAPPGDNEIPFLCPAARGGAGDSGSGGRTPSARPRTCPSLTGGDSSGQKGSPVKAATLAVAGGSADHATPRALAGDNSTTNPT